MTKHPSRAEEQTQRRQIGFAGVAIMLALIILVFTSRFYGIFDQGASGSDNLYYINIAKHWAEGHPVHRIASGNLVHRPLVFSLYSLAIALFGYEDYSIKLLNAGADCVNVLMIFIIAWKIADKRNRFLVAVASSTTYTLLPQALYMSRSELTHTLSTTMVLVSLASFLFGIRERRKIIRSFYFFLAGLGIAGASLAHEELILLAVGYLIFSLIFGVFDGDEGKPFIERLLVQYIPSSIIFLAPVVIAGLSIWSFLRREAGGIAVVSDGISRDFSLIELFSRLPRLAWSGIVGNSSQLFFTSFLLIASIWIARVLFGFRCSRPYQKLSMLLSMLPLTLAGIHLFLYSVVFEDMLPRIFLPIFPVLAIAFYVYLSSLLARQSSSAKIGVTFFAVLLMALSSLDEYGRFHRNRFINGHAPFSVSFDWNLLEGFGDLRRHIYHPSYARQLYDSLGAAVHEDAKVLVASSTVYPYPGRRALQLGFYFGDDAVYSIDHFDLSLDEIIRQCSVRYILITHTHEDQRVLNWSSFDRYMNNGRWDENSPLRLGEGYGFAPGEFTVALEKQHILSHLEELGAEKIPGPAPGEIFDISGSIARSVRR